MKKTTYLKKYSFKICYEGDGANHLTLFLYTTKLKSKQKAFAPFVD